MAAPEIYTSTSADIEDVILTTGSPYQYYSAYSVTAPSLATGDVVHVDALAEVTASSSYSYQIFVGRFISTEQAYGTNTEPPTVTFEATGEDIFAAGNDRHMVIGCNVWADGFSGDQNFSLILYAASTSAGGDDYLVLNEGGGIQVTIFRAS